MTCNGSQDQISQGYPLIEFVTVLLPNTHNSLKLDRDVRVQFVKAYRFIMVASINDSLRSAGVYLHFFPLAYKIENNPSNVIQASGGEPWIALSNSFNGNGSCEGKWIKFKNPIDHFFIDVDHGVGNVNGQMTFLGSNDIESAVVNRK